VVSGYILGVWGVSGLTGLGRINSCEADPEAVALWRDKKFRTFMYAVTGAYSGILIRCIYR
jgi:hypothetical protein